MAKKESTTKKTTAKKSTTKKSTSVKKAVKKVVEEVNEPIVNEKEEEKLETPTTAIEENNIITKEIPSDDDVMFHKEIMEHITGEILAENNNDLDKFMNTPDDVMVEKAKEKIQEIKKINNEEVNNRIDKLFGYLWNGQEIDY